MSPFIVASLSILTYKKTNRKRLIFFARESPYLTLYLGYFLFILKKTNNKLNNCSNIHTIAFVIKIPSITYSYIVTTFSVFYSNYNFFSTFSNSSNNAGLLGYLCFNSSINDLAVSLPFHFISCAIFFVIFLYSRLSFARAQLSLISL